MVEPPPGSAPTRKPTTEPFTNAKRQSFMSCSVGSRFLSPLASQELGFLARFHVREHFGEREHADGDDDEVDSESSSIRPKVKREVELNRSVPTLAIQRPSSAASSALTIERPRAAPPGRARATSARNTRAS